MFDLNPPFYIYEPPLLMFGGVEITPPYRSSNTIQEMHKILRSIENSISQAYEIYMKVSPVSNNRISTEISPLIATVKNNCKDFLIGSYPKGNKELAKILSQRLILQNREAGLFYHNKGFYVVQRLKEKFDPVVAELVIKSIKSAILQFTYNQFRVTSSISDNLLRVDAEVIPKTVYIV